jgi:spore photoproduct lyase
MNLFQPTRVFFEPAALDYPLGRQIYDYFTRTDIPITFTGSHNRITGIPGRTPQESYREGKRTLAVGVKRDLRFEPCKPSADFQFALGTSCPGQCQYCYLQTHLGKKPYIRVYVNIAEIMARIKATMTAHLPAVTTFEAASTSDPLAVEHITGSLAQTINFFGTLSHARLRVVTKFANVAPLLKLDHQGHTKFRFSLNTTAVIKEYEQQTASFPERVAAANQIAQAGYALGFIIAPLFIYPGYQADYEALFEQLSLALNPRPERLSFELITHRFTARAKNIILERFPGTKLDLNETGRRRKYGRYGLVKYIYPKNDYTELQKNILTALNRFFPKAEIEYFT